MSGSSQKPRTHEDGPTRRPSGETPQVKAFRAKIDSFKDQTLSEIKASNERLTEVDKKLQELALPDEPTDPAIEAATEFAIGSPHDDEVLERTPDELLEYEWEQRIRKRQRDPEGA